MLLEDHKMRVHKKYKGGSKKTENILLGFNRKTSEELI